MNSQHNYNSTSSFRRVAHDVLDLAELQMELLSVDSQAARRKLSRAIVLATIAVALGGSALTVCMVGGGFLIAELSELSRGVGMLIVGGGAFLIVAVLAGVAWKAVLGASAAMNETKSEFAENLRWLKATLISPATSPRNQLRRESFPSADPELADDIQQQTLMRNGSPVEHGPRSIR